MPTPMPKAPVAELQVLRRHEAEQQTEPDDVERDDRERERPARLHSAGVSERETRSHRDPCTREVATAMAGDDGSAPCLVQALRSSDVFAITT